MTGRPADRPPTDGSGTGVARARGRLRRWSAAGVTAAIALVVLSAGTWVNTHRLSADDAQRPFTRPGMVGSTVTTRTMSVTVEHVTGASTLDSGGTRTTNGVWVLVTIMVSGVGATVTPGYAQLTDAAGQSFGVSQRFLQDIGSRQVQPGIPVEMDLAFEVPTTARDLHLRIGASVDPTMDEIADIALGVDSGSLTAWAASTTVVTWHAAGVPGQREGDR